MLTRHRARTTAVALLGPLVLVLAGCTGAGGTDDELQPRATPTVTVTGAPQQRLPAALDLGSGSTEASPADDVVFALDAALRVGDRPVDLEPVLPERLVVLPRGLLVLADQDVWFLAGQVVRGLPLPPVTSLDLSADGSQLVLTTSDREPPIAYSLSGERIADAEVEAPRTQRRTVRGPGAVEVLDGADGPQVVDPEGGIVPVADLPEDLEVRGWVGPDQLYGVGTVPGGDATGPGVLTCTVAEGARCEQLEGLPDDVDPDRLDDVVFGAHPAG